jgi:hypothetical protein
LILDFFDRALFTQHHGFKCAGSSLFFLRRRHENIRDVGGSGIELQRTLFDQVLG